MTHRHQPDGACRTNKKFCGIQIKRNKNISIHPLKTQSILVDWAVLRLPRRVEQSQSIKGNCFVASRSVCCGCFPYENVPESICRNQGKCSLTICSQSV